MANRSEQGIYTSPFPAYAPFQDGTVFDYACGALHPLYGRPGADDRLFVQDYSSQRAWSAKDARTLVTQIAATLISKYACRPGDHVLLCYPTSATFAMLCFACARAGLVMCLANPAYTATEMRHACTLVHAKLVLTVDAFMPIVRNAGVSGATIVDAADPPSVMTQAASTSAALFANLLSVEESETVLARAGANTIGSDAPCGIFFSSGTTGLPKAVLVSHRNLIALTHALFSIPGYATPASWNEGKPSNAVVFLPAFHIAGLATLVVSAIEGGCVCFALSNPIDLKLIVAAIREHRPYRSIFVPPLLLAMTRTGVAGPQGLSGCCHALYTAAAPCGKGLQTEAQQKLKVIVGQFWGLSETTGAVTGSDLTKDTKAGSCGQVLPGMEMRIIDESGKIAKHGKAGEICMRGPMVMLRYYNNEKATAETLDKDGWLHTGDIGYMDDEGFLFIVDRIKELIKYKGFQVAPAELEALLLSHPAIMDVGVTGVDDGSGVGEAPRAFVVVRPDAQEAKHVEAQALAAGQVLRPSEADLAKDIAAFVAERLSNYKQLRAGVVFVKEIPKNPSGKILRRVLRDLSKSDQSKL